MDIAWAVRLESLKTCISLLPGAPRGEDGQGVCAALVPSLVTPKNQSSQSVPSVHCGDVDFDSQSMLQLGSRLEGERALDE